MLRGSLIDLLSVKRVNGVWNKKKRKVTIHYAMQNPELFLNMHIKIMYKGDYVSKSEQKRINSRKLIGWFNGLGLKRSLCYRLTVKAIFN